jgi:hypothetical protein
MSKKEKWKTVENQDSMGKTNFFLSTLPFSAWALNTCFEQNFTMGSYGVGIGRAWCSWRAYKI